MSDTHGTGHILQSLVVNLLISVAKGFGAAWSGSGAMLAETIHSAADCGNQLLLLLGVKRAHKPADSKHPLGYGRALYFWSFMVALLLFCGGGVFSIYEGIHKIQHPEPLEFLGLSFGILLFSLLLEGYATYSNIREIAKRRGSVKFWRYLSSTKDSDLVVVFGENLAATLGLIVALLAVATAYLTGNSFWDGVGSLGIGLILIVIAVMLSLEVKGLLLGESASEEIRTTVQTAILELKPVASLLHLISLQQGPGQVLLMLKLSFTPGTTLADLTTAINQLEDRIRAKHPEVKWCFVEPDRQRA